MTILNTKPKYWCKALFSASSKCDIVNNNLAEAFNGRILKARCKSIMSTLKDIRVIIMKRLHSNRFTNQDWVGQLGPKVSKKLHNNKHKS